MTHVRRAPDITVVFGSVGKTKILDLLAKVSEINITALARKTGLNHGRLSHHLQELQDMGVVTEKRFGRIKIYKIDEVYDWNIKLKKFLTEWKEESEEEPVSKWINTNN